MNQNPSLRILANRPIFEYYMKKSNSKALYQFSRRQKAKENFPPSQDSLDVQPLPRRKPTHLRSQSCPFENQPINEPTSHFKDDRESQFCGVSTRGMRKKPHHQSSCSQISLSSNTVIIREMPLEQLSSLLFRKTTVKGDLMKKSIAGWKGRETYAQTCIVQQMRSYELRQQLQAVEKQTASSCIKQRTLESLLGRYQQEVLEGSYDFS